MLKNYIFVEDNLDGAIASAIFQRLHEGEYTLITKNDKPDYLQFLLNKETVRNYDPPSCRLFFIGVLPKSRQLYDLKELGYHFITIIANAEINKAEFNLYTNNLLFVKNSYFGKPMTNSELIALWHAEAWNRQFGPALRSILSALQEYVYIGAPRDKVDPDEFYNGRLLNALYRYTNIDDQYVHLIMKIMKKTKCYFAETLYTDFPDLMEILDSALMCEDYKISLMLNEEFNKSNYLKKSYGTVVICKDGTIDFNALMHKALKNRIDYIVQLAYENNMEVLKIADLRPINDFTTRDVNLRVLEQIDSGSMYPNPRIRIYRVKERVAISDMFV